MIFFQNFQNVTKILKLRMLSAKKEIMSLNSQNGLIKNSKKFQDEKLGKN